MRTLFLFTATGIASCLYAGAFAVAELIPPERLINWSRNGVIAPDGTRAIPGFPNCTSPSVIAGNSDSLQNAIDNCPLKTTINVPAGIYTGVTIGRAVVIRGAGPNKTLINGEISVSPYGGSYGGTIVPRTWTGGLTKGSTVVTLSNASGLSVGKTIGMDQLNDSALVNIVGNAGTSGTLSRNGTSWEDGKNRALLQVNKVIAMNGNQITLENPVYLDHLSSLSPEIFWWDGNLEYAGIENLTVDGSSLTSGAITFNYCTNCWVKGVEIKNVARAGIQAHWYSYRIEVRDSYLHHSQGGSDNCGPTRYGIELDWTSASLVENNIIQEICAPIITDFAVGGNVIGYNYIGAPQSAWMFAGLAVHVAHSYGTLFEGNYAHSLNADNVWGSGSHDLIFRNRLTGWSSASYNQRTALILERYHRYVTVVGNVLGTENQTTTYQFDNTNIGNDLGIYSFGFYNSGQPGTSSYDTLTKSTLLRWGNYDTVNRAIVWNTAERPDGLNETRNIPASLYYSEKPSWWGTSSWPPYGPEPSNPSLLANGVLPAEGCYQTQHLGAGGAFDPSVCYAVRQRPTLLPPYLHPIGK